MHVFNSKGKCINCCKDYNKKCNSKGKSGIAHIESDCKVLLAKRARIHSDLKDRNA